MHLFISWRVRLEEAPHLPPCPTISIAFIHCRPECRAAHGLRTTSGPHEVAAGWRHLSGLCGLPAWGWGCMHVSHLPPPILLVSLASMWVHMPPTLLHHFHRRIRALSGHCRPEFAMQHLPGPPPGSTRQLAASIRKVWHSCMGVGMHVSHLPHAPSCSRPLVSLASTGVHPPAPPCSMPFVSLASMGVHAPLLTHHLVQGP